MKNKKKKGFTLVELLVVIAILAILASVTVVGYMGFTKKAKESVRDQEIAQVKTVLYGTLINDTVSSTLEDGTKVTVSVVGTGDDRKLEFSASCLDESSPKKVKTDALNALFKDLAPLDELLFTIEVNESNQADKIVFTASNKLTADIFVRDIFK